MNESKISERPKSQKIKRSNLHQKSNSIKVPKEQDSPDFKFTNSPRERSRDYVQSHN